MPYGDQRRYQRLTLSDPAYWVELRALTTFDVTDVFEQAGVAGEDGTTRYPFRPLANETLITAIRSWNLDDAEGRPLPISGEGFRLLLPDDLNLLLRRATRGTRLRPVIDGIIGPEEEDVEPAEADFRRGAVPPGGGLAAAPAGDLGTPGQPSDQPGGDGRAPVERAA